MDATYAMHPSLTLTGARRVLDAALDHADRIGVPACIAVVDRTGGLLTYARMDGAPALSEQIARDKAYSVAAFNGLPTHEWWSVLEDKPALRAGLVKTDRLVIFGGGVPIAAEVGLLGAIGVSGGSADQDREIADAGVAAHQDVA